MYLADERILGIPLFVSDMTPIVTHGLILKAMSPQVALACLDETILTSIYTFLEDTMAHHIIPKLKCITCS